MIDTASGTFYPVPATFTADEEGHLQASIYRKGNSVYSIVNNNKQFADLAGDHYAKKSVEALASKFIVNGYQDGTFGADQSVTRAEFVTMLVKALGLVSKGEQVSPFSDVQAGEWYTNSILTAVQHKLVSGYTDGTFQPNKTITREELVVMVKNALQSANYKNVSDEASIQETLQQFTDEAAISEWAGPSAAATLKAGIIGGFEDNTFRPNSLADRGQCAVMIHRMLQALHFTN
nr:S-layer homology domain-containing protein [Paenibacillus turpanensis]